MCSDITLSLLSVLKLWCCFPKSNEHQPSDGQIHRSAEHCPPQPFTIHLLWQLTLLITLTDLLHIAFWWQYNQSSKACQSKMVRALFGSVWPLDCLCKMWLFTICKMETLKLKIFLFLCCLLLFIVLFLLYCFYYFSCINDIFTSCFNAVYYAFLSIHVKHFRNAFLSGALRITFNDLKAERIP